MIIYECLLELHDNLFFATREMGRFYETTSFIHNYALTYALGYSGNNIFPVSDYFIEEQIPKYKEHLSNLDFYVTPAKPLDISFVFNTFKLGEEDFYLKSTIGDNELKRRLGVDGGGNKPDFGKVKEVSVGSTFSFFIISNKEIESIPRWIRLGKWLSKAKLDIKGVYKSENIKKGVYKSSIAVNPIDLVKDRILNFDIIAMPPSSLINNATIEGEYIEFGDEKNKICLPNNLKYRF